MLIRGSPNGARHPIHTPAAIGRNRWPSSTGMAGRHQSEPLAAIARYAQSVTSTFNSRSAKSAHSASAARSI